MAAEFLANTVEDSEVPLNGAMNPKHGAAQVVFPDPVGPDHPTNSIQESERNVLQRDGAGKSESGVVEANNGMGHARVVR